MAPIRDLANVVDALHIGQWTVASVRAEEWWNAAARYTGQLATTIGVIHAHGGNTIPLVTALTLATICVVETVGARKTDVVLPVTELPWFAIIVAAAAFQRTTQVPDAE